MYTQLSQNLKKQDVIGHQNGAKETLQRLLDIPHGEKNKMILQAIGYSQEEIENAMEEVDF